MNTCDVGDLVRCSGVFTDEDGNAVDPGAVYCKILDPSGNVATYQYGEDDEVVRDDTGTYHVDVDVDEGGDWWYRFYSTGSAQAAGEAVFWAQASQF